MLGHSQIWNSWLPAFWQNDENTQRLKRITIQNSEFEILPTKVSLWHAKWIPYAPKFATGASLRCTRFELYAFRSNISTTHENFGQCIAASRALKKVVQKLHKWQEMAPHMTNVSAVWLTFSREGQNSWIIEQASTSMVGLRNLDFYFQKMLRFRAFEYAWWTFEYA